MSLNSNIPSAAPPSTPSVLPQPPNKVPLKLTKTNYVLWKLQFEPFLNGYDLSHHVDGSSSAPPTTLSSGEPNLVYHCWRREDKLVLG
ncbi:unnamed protein product [Linum trigynum]|uniref:Retrotransposon Copia-like N-terminal domain-containing protein n=1 Tax=Linum trigynum TaxID=586398 RepID=A0AAV2CFN4_9ROSI